MTKLEEFDEKNLIKNPFEFTLQIPVTELISNIEYIKDMEEGIIVPKGIVLERTKSIKLYYCEDCKDFVANLSDKAQRLYLHILYNLLHGKDWIQINSEYYMKKNGISSINTFKNAIKELMRYSFISPTEYKTVFWINPNLFFAGNRLKKYPNNIKIESVWEK